MQHQYFPSHLLSSPVCSLPSSRNSDPGSHSRPFSPPTHYGSCLAFLSREDFSSFFPRRLASNCAFPRKALSAVDPFFIFANIFKISLQQYCQVLRVVVFTLNRSFLPKDISSTPIVLPDSSSQRDTNSFEIHILCLK